MNPQTTTLSHSTAQQERPTMHASVRARLQLHHATVVDRVAPCGCKYTLTNGVVTGFVDCRHHREA